MQWRFPGVTPLVFMTTETDAQLLERYSRGDTSAFADLVRSHQGSLLRYAGGLLGAGGGVEDVVQEAFIRLSQSPPQLPEPLLTEPEGARRQLSAWLHKVTRNLCMDVLRSETRRRVREQEAAATEAGSGGLERVEEEDTRAAVQRSLQDLPEDQREVLVLRLLGEKSYREISEITGRKVGTVGWLLSMGLRSLSEELAPLLGTQPKLDVAQGDMS